MNRTCSQAATRWLTLGLVLAASACTGDDPLGPDQGRVHFVLSSGTTPTTAPSDSASFLTQSWDATSEPATHDRDEDHDYRYFQTANVTLSSILARNQDGQLVDVTMDLPVTVDVMAVERGDQISLPQGDLPAGTYDQLVVVITHVEGVARDSTQVTLTPPGGGWTAIVPTCPFTVEDGGATTVSLQFMVRKAFIWSGTHFRFEPKFTCEEGVESGS